MLEYDQSHVARLEAAWTALQDVARLAPIRNAKQHTEMLELLDYLEKQVGERRAHPLSDLLDIVIDLVSEYESEHFPIPDAHPGEVLKFLMEQHALKQSDLAAELGSQSVVSEILRGKREINARQAKALANRFKVKATAFI